MDGDQIAVINQQVREQETDPELAELACALKQSQVQAEHELNQRRTLLSEQRHFRKQQRSQAEAFTGKKKNTFYWLAWRKKVCNKSVSYNASNKSGNSVLPLYSIG